MNNKMEIHTYLSPIESKKNKLSKQEQKQNHGYGKHFDDCQIGGGFLVSLVSSLLNPFIC